jgi:hypothetical protein
METGREAFVSDAPHDKKGTSGEQMELRPAERPAQPRKRASRELTAAQRSAVASGMYPAAWAEDYDERDDATPEETQATFEAAGVTAPVARPDDIVEITLRCTRATAEKLQRDAAGHPTAQSAVIKELDR